MILSLNIIIWFSQRVTRLAGGDAAEADTCRDPVLVGHTVSGALPRTYASSVRLIIAFVGSRRFPHGVVQCLRVSDPDDLLARPENDGIIDHCVAGNGRIHG